LFPLTPLIVTTQRALGLAWFTTEFGIKQGLLVPVVKLKVWVSSAAPEPMPVRFTVRGPAAAGGRKPFSLALTDQWPETALARDAPK